MATASAADIACLQELIDDDSGDDENGFTLELGSTKMDDVVQKPAKSDHAYAMKWLPSEERTLFDVSELPSDTPRQMYYYGDLIDAVDVVHISDADKGAAACYANKGDGELHTNGEYLDIIVLVAEQCGCSHRTAMDSLAANEDDIIEAIMALNVAEADYRDSEVKFLGG
jgi:hypothetical protein